MDENVNADGNGRRGRMVAREKYERVRQEGLRREAESRESALSAQLTEALHANAASTQALLAMAKENARLRHAIRTRDYEADMERDPLPLPPLEAPPDPPGPLEDAPPPPPAHMGRPRGVMRAASEAVKAGASPAAALAAALMGGVP